jgi:putative sigma-54 modulation protein
MHIKFTARRFRARPELKTHAIDAVTRLDRFYDGIVHADVILSYEGATKNIKIAEVNLHVYGVVLSGKEKSDDFHKSIDAAVEKVSLQLLKYKSKLRAKDKTKVRALQDKV